MTDFTIAECGIRQLHAKFVDVVWRQDVQGFGECFALLGEWKIGGLHIVGREAIEETCRNSLGRCSHIQLLPQPCLLQVSGEVAQGRQHMIELARMNDGSSAMTIGIYHDAYALEDGLWKFQSRFWSLKYRGPTDLSANFFATPDYGPFPATPRPDEQTFNALTAPQHQIS